jgi:hypothetical protein
MKPEFKLKKCPFCGKMRPSYLYQSHIDHHMKGLWGEQKEVNPRQMIDLTPLQACKAIMARIDGVFDDPHLTTLGTLSTDTLSDVRFIARQAIAREQKTRA